MKAQREGSDENEHAAVSKSVLGLCTSLGCTPGTVNHADLMLYRHRREGRGSGTALFLDGDTYTYSQLAEISALCAAWLREQGVQPGDCVLVLLPDSPMLVAVYFGVVAMGGIAVLLDPALSREESFHIAQHCRARLTIGYNELLGNLTALQRLPGMLAVVGARRSWTQPSGLTAALEAVGAPDYSVSTAPGGHAYGLLTSGSTGRPKLIVHRHQDILYGFFGLALPILGLSQQDCVLSVPKMTTGYGLGCSLLMPFLGGACSALVSQRPSPALLAEMIESRCCTLLFAQPRFLAEATSQPMLAERMRSLRLVITGGEPLSSALAERWRRLFRTELIDSYGTTEVGFLFISNRPGSSRAGSVGKPIHGLHVEVTDEEGQAVAWPATGRLRVRGPMVVPGYWKDAQRSRETFGDGWFLTSDIFSIDPEGYYYIHGRSDHQIKLGCGDWVNPYEVESVLLEHPHVGECAVVGTPDDDGLTMLKAMVVLGPGVGVSHDVLATELGARVRRRWPQQEYKRLGAIVFVDVLPRTIAGKLDRGRLKPQSMTEFSYRC